MILFANSVVLNIFWEIFFKFFKLSLNCIMLERSTARIGTDKLLSEAQVKVLGQRKDWAVWLELPSSMLSTSSNGPFAKIRLKCQS